VSIPSPSAPPAVPTASPAGDSNGDVGARRGLFGR